VDGGGAVPSGAAVTLNSGAATAAAARELWRACSGVVAQLLVATGGCATLTSSEGLIGDPYGKPALLVAPGTPVLRGVGGCWNDAAAALA
jgi:hypothetical protein